VATSKKSKAKPAPDDGTVKVQFRFAPSLLASLDAWADALNAASSGPRWTRTDVVKAALERALKERGTKGEAP
jgi:hypothetical protein